MGQYHKVVNIDKKQYLHPHTLGNNIKLLEFGCDALGTTTGLVALLACSNGRGGGDLRSDNAIIGSWAGDRIAIVGDYWEPEEAEASGIPTWEKIAAEFQDISREVVRALCDDPWIRSVMLERAADLSDIEAQIEDWTWLFSAECPSTLIMSAKTPFRRKSCPTFYMKYTLVCEIHDT
jgi:hypothetical protein